MQHIEEQQRAVVEIEDAEKANLLALSDDYRQPYFSEKRNKYIFIRKMKK